MTSPALGLVVVPGDIILTTDIPDGDKPSQVKVTRSMSGMCEVRARSGYETSIMRSSIVEVVGHEEPDPE